MRTKRGLRGFTLVEVLVSALIVSFLIAGIYGILNIGTMSYNIDLSLLGLQQNARLAMAWMVRELREAEASDISIESIGADDDRVIFDTPNEDNIRFYRDISDVNNDSVVNQIIREFPSGTYKILGNNISSLQFSLSGYSLEIQLQADRLVSGRNLSFPLTAKVGLRNE
ncbi:PilW family protein [Candidatus Omnitrophota bacterium]